MEKAALTPAPETPAPTPAPEAPATDTAAASDVDPQPADAVDTAAAPDSDTPEAARARAPGNAGIAQDAQCLPLASQSEIKDFCKEKSIDLVVVGPEQPLVEGLADTLRAAGIAVFGPDAEAAELEGVQLVQ